MQPNRNLAAVVVIGTLLVAGCSPNAQKVDLPAADPPQAKELASKSPAADVPVLKIALYIDGRVTADGGETTVEKMYGLLATQKALGGAVWCYCEGGDSAPHTNAILVRNAIKAQELPVRLSTQPDYSDEFRSDGKPRSSP